MKLRIEASRTNGPFKRIDFKGDILLIFLYTQCFAPKVGGIESVMTNIAQHAFNTRNKVTVLSDGSKLFLQILIVNVNLIFTDLIKSSFLEKELNQVLLRIFKKNKIDIIFLIVGNH